MRADRTASLTVSCELDYLGGLSSFFFSFANIIIHDLWNTNTRNWMNNDASSYIDLSPLYGSTEADVNSVRRKHFVILLEHS